MQPYTCPVEETTHAFHSRTTDLGLVDPVGVECCKLAGGWEASVGPAVDWVASVTLAGPAVDWVRGSELEAVSTLTGEPVPFSAIPIFE